jgi:hypothetical protein
MRTRKSQGGGHRGRSGMKGQAYHGGGAVWPQVRNRREPPRPYGIGISCRSRSGLVDPPGVTMLTRSTLLSSTTSTSRRRLHCSLPLAGDRTDPESLAGLLPSRRYAYALFWAKISGDGTNRAGNSRRGLTGGAYRAVRAQKVGRRDRAVGILGVGEGSRRRTALSPRSRRGRFARQVGNSPDTRTATAPAVSRIEAIWKQFATNSRNSLLFGRAARLLRRRP